MARTHGVRVTPAVAAASGRWRRASSGRSSASGLCPSLQTAQSWSASCPTCGTADKAVELAIATINAATDARQPTDRRREPVRRRLHCSNINLNLAKIFKSGQEFNALFHRMGAWSTPGDDVRIRSSDSSRRHPGSTAGAVCTSVASEPAFRESARRRCSASGTVRRRPGPTDSNSSESRSPSETPTSLVSSRAVIVRSAWASMPSTQARFGR